jgi:hypothetical protein
MKLGLRALVYIRTACRVKNDLRLEELNNLKVE